MIDLPQRYQRITINKLVVIFVDDNAESFWN